MFVINHPCPVILYRFLKATDNHVILFSSSLIVIYLTDAIIDDIMMKHLEAAV